MMNIESAASDFLMHGIQEWGQSDEKRAKATADYLRAAGFQVKDSGFPVFGRLISKHGIEGRDGDVAKAWLVEILKMLPRGRYQDEQNFLVEALQLRLADIAEPDDA